MRRSGPWDKGSTREYRKRRLLVLQRDRWICQICHKSIDPNLKMPHPGSATVHHTIGKRYGDQMEQMVAAHWLCNLKIGEPGTRGDPAPVGVTRW
jgi:5-methylcytosine-specific restriction endonuclease McrA